MMVHGVFNGTVEQQYDCTQRFRKLLSIGELRTVPRSSCPSVRNAGDAGCRAQPSH